MARSIKWGEIPWEEVNENVSRKVIMGDRMMMVMYKFAAGLVWPEEIHLAEQGGYVLKGRYELHSKGEKHLILPGNSYFVESNVPHSSHFIEETILIDVFSPPRKELMEEKGGFAPYATQQKTSASQE
jgi:quercetin dioxygenase-like cupin family protein